MEWWYIYQQAVLVDAPHVATVLQSVELSPTDFRLSYTIQHPDSPPVLLVLKFLHMFPSARLGPEVEAHKLQYLNGLNQHEKKTIARYKPT